MALVETGNVKGAKREKIGPRAKLLAAALDYVRKNGVGEITLRQIAGELDTSHRMLHYHFGSKEGLLAAIVSAIEAESTGLFAELRADAHLPPLEQIWRLWTFVTHPDRADGDRVWVEIYGQALQGRAHAADLLPGIVEAWLGPLGEVCARLGAPKNRLAQDSRLMLGVIRGLSLDLLATGDRDAADDAFRRFLDLYQHGVATAPETRAGKARKAPVRRQITTD